MRVFWMKFVDLAVIAVVLFVYQAFVTERSARDAYEQKLQASASAWQEAAQTKEETTAVYADGTYTGSGTGFGGTITVRLTVEADTITELTVLSAGQETPEYLEAAEALLDTIVEENSVEVETVSGATFSSNGILEGAANALEQAKQANKTE